MGYVDRMRGKDTAKWGGQMTGMNFQTRSRIFEVGTVSRIKTDEVELAYMKIFEREEMIHEEGREEGLAQGVAQGIIQGQTEHLIQLIIKKAAKGKILDQIAEELEEDTAIIAPLCDLVMKNPGGTASELLPYVSHCDTAGPVAPQTQPVL